MEKKIYYAQVVHPRFGDDRKHPYKYTVPAFRYAPHVWQVGGNDDVCCFLLDSGEGLILIDTGYTESVYLTVDRIWRSGFDPADIKKILLTHWHWDHCNGAAMIQQLTGGKAEIWLSKEDEVLHQKWKDDTSELEMIDYEVTNFYDDNKPIKLGRFTIETFLTPGHTPGVTSFRFTDTDDETGKTYRLALHGGLGVPMMRPDLRERWDVTEDMCYQFVSDCEKMAEWPIDIALQSHLNQGNIKPNIPEDTNDYSVWIADYAWKDVLLNRAEAVKAFYPEKYGKKN